MMESFQTWVDLGLHHEQVDSWYHCTCYRQLLPAMTGTLVTMGLGATLYISSRTGKFSTPGLTQLFCTVMTVEVVD